MAHEIYPAALQSMIDRAGSLSAEQIDKLGQLWESDEELIMEEPSISAELMGEVNPPLVANQSLIDAWQHALDAAGQAGRVERSRPLKQRGARHIVTTVTSKTARVRRMDQKKQSDPRCSRLG
jgi:hypothetical protein